MSMPTNSTRKDYIDIARGFAILMVIAGHFLQYNTTGATRSFDFIYSFHMPLFFFISGWVATFGRSKLKEGAYLPFLKKRAISLVLPFFIWGCFGDIYPIDSNKLMCSFVTLIRQPDTGPWFLINLFCIQFVYLLSCCLASLIHKQWKSKMADVISAVTLIMLMAIFSFLVGGSPYFSVFYTIAFFIGFFIHTYSTDDNIPVWLSSISFALFYIYYPTFHFASSPNILRCALGVAASLFIIPICKKWEEKGSAQHVLYQAFKLLGTHSLEIYLTHYWFIKLLAKEYHWDFSVFTPIGSFLLATIISIPIAYITMLCAESIKKIPGMSLLLYGKK